MLLTLQRPTIINIKQEGLKNKTTMQSLRPREYPAAHPWNGPSGDVDLEALKCQ